MMAHVFRPALPYIGLPIISTALLVLRAAQLGPLITLQFVMLIILGYITAVFDIKTQIIPNRIILIMLASWVMIITPSLLYNTDAAAGMMVDAIFGFALGGGLFLIVYIISHKELGGGDVKFMAASGLYLGMGRILPAIFFGTVLAALTGLTLILMKKIGRKDTIPLAPFLFAGILITVFVM